MSKIWLIKIKVWCWGQNIGFKVKIGQKVVYYGQNFGFLKFENWFSKGKNVSKVRFLKVKNVAALGVRNNCFNVNVIRIDCDGIDREWIGQEMIETNLPTAWFIAAWYASTSLDGWLTAWLQISR